MEKIFPPPPEGPPIDSPYTDEDGTVWYYYSPAGVWSMTEPVDKDRWDAIMQGNATTDGMPEPPEYFENVKKQR